MNTHLTRFAHLACTSLFLTGCIVTDIVPDTTSTTDTGDGDSSGTGDGDSSTGDGDSSTGDGDGTSTSGDGTTGDGTTGDGDGCEVLDVSGMFISANDQGIYVAAPVSPNIDGPNIDILTIEFWTPTVAPGTFTLGVAAGGNDNYGSCGECGVLWSEAYQGKVFFATSGTVTVDTVVNSLEYSGSFANLILEEVTLDAMAFSTPVPGGACYTIAGGSWDTILGGDGDGDGDGDGTGGDGDGTGDGDGDGTGGDGDGDGDGDGGDGDGDGTSGDGDGDGTGGDGDGDGDGTGGDGDGDGTGGDGDGDGTGGDGDGDGTGGDGDGDGDGTGGDGDGDGDGTT